MKTAQDYYPFGMVMPGRMFTAIAIPGGTYSGTTNLNGYTLPVDLTVNSRSSTTPSTYTATHDIDLTEGFESGTNDDVTAYIADASYAGGGNGDDDGSAIAGTGKYRYGFNGKEKDDEVKGVGDQVDYGMRVYDPRVGRFMSVDPLTAKYAFYTPYQYAGDKPIFAIDRDGLEDAFSSYEANYQISRYEGELRKKDPEHADQIIYEQNKHAFIFVGGMLTGGSGKLFAMFTDGLLAWGGYKMTQGIVKNNSNDIKDGAETITTAITGDLTGKLLGKLFSGILPGSPKAPYVTEPDVSGGIKADAAPETSGDVSFDREKVITFANYKKRPLGWYEYSEDKGLELDLRIPKDLQKQGFGTKIFTDAVNSTNAKKFTATWIESENYSTGSSVNLERYKAAVEGGASETEAAWQTWSGQQAKKAGFTHVEIKVLNSKLAKGVQATFTK